MNEQLRADIKRELSWAQPTAISELLNRCYVALGEQQSAEPIGEIYDMDGVHMAIWINGTPEVGTKLYAGSSTVQDVMILNGEVEALRGQLATLRQHTLEVLEPWADVKPRDWKTDREKLWRLHDDIKRQSQ